MVREAGYRGRTDLALRSPLARPEDGATVRRVPGPFADDELAEFAAQPSPAFAELDVAAMREGIAERARGRPRGPELHAVRDLRIGGLAARLYRPTPTPRRSLSTCTEAAGRSASSIPSTGSVADSRRARAPRCSRSTTDSRPSTRGRPRSMTPSSRCAGWGSLPEELGEAPSAVAVAGDSAGGTLAALACLRLRDEHPEALPDLQVLIYVNTDLTGALPSMRESATEGGGLDGETERFFISQWVPADARWSDPGVSPLHAPDLSGLPGALIVSAELDPLRDDSEAYAGRLRDAGVEVELRCEPGLIHNFMQLDEISPACAAAADRVAADLRARLAHPEARS